jgi:hypothetical protein
MASTRADSWARWIGLATAALLVEGCGKEPANPAPPRVTAPAEIPVEISRVALPLSAPVADLERLINAQMPQTLLTIDRDEEVCAKPTRLTVCLKHARPCKGEECKSVPCKVGFQNAKVTPTIKCRIVGTVTRGPIRVTGEGERIRLTMPVSAEVSAKDIGHIVKSETATAAAEVRAWVRVDTTPDWQPTATVEIDYDWTEKPGIEFLGKRITFAGKADPKLREVIAKLEADMPRHLAKLGLREQLADVWADGFTSVSINRRNPEVWMRLTPRQLGFGGYRVEGDRLVLRLALEAGTETFVGDRPPDPRPTPLPPRAPVEALTGLRFHAPVVADYRQLEPVLEKELAKLAARPLDLPVAGPTRVTFGRPTVYTTEGGRIAVGLPVDATASRRSLSTQGMVWLTGVPTNAPNSRLVTIEDLGVEGEASGVAGELLLAIGRYPAVIEQVAGGLSENFEGDFRKLMALVNNRLAALPIGKSLLADARVTSVENGVVKPVGQGLWMPVTARGEAELSYDPAGVARVLAERRAEREARAARRAREAAEKADAGEKAGAGVAPVPG